jgi:hypothetical protein
MNEQNEYVVKDIEIAFKCGQTHKKNINFP